MRSIAEIKFRVRQEAANLLLLASPPDFCRPAPRSLALPNGRTVARALQGTEYAGTVERIAEQILAHRFPLLGATVETGKHIHWRRDYLSGKESGTGYFRRIPYLDSQAVGDHKFIWELNRHQHWVLLAQAYLLTGRDEFKIEIWDQLASWLRQNPFQRGINWASALEVAFRALSWIWVYHLLGAEMPNDVRSSLLTGLNRHGHHLAHNQSIYFSPNTHLLGEAVALFTIGVLFPSFPNSRAWRKRAAGIAAAQLDFQVLRDGAHFEQSTYYHVYALDLFLLFYVLSGRPVLFRPTLERMAEYLFAILGPARSISFLGDDDGGRTFHPYGSRDQFGRATLTTAGLLFDRQQWIGRVDDIAEQASWWMGAETLQAARSQPSTLQNAQLFPDAGAAFLRSGAMFLQMDCGAFGWGSAGHSHSDTLSLVLWLREEPVLIDPGTYSYSDETARSWFRGSAAHNTVRIDGLDQGRPAGQFRWASKPEVALEVWRPAADGGFIRARCHYSGFTHCRTVLLEAEQLLVLDEIEGPAGEHTCEQTWQLGPAAANVQFQCSVASAEIRSKFSPAYGELCRGRAIVATLRGELPVSIATVFAVQLEEPISPSRARERIARFMRD